MKNRLSDEEILELYESYMSDISGDDLCDEEYWLPDEREVVTSSDKEEPEEVMGEVKAPTSSS